MNIVLKYNEVPSMSVKNNKQDYLMTTMSLFQLGKLILFYYPQLKIYGPPRTAQFLKLTMRLFIVQRPQACIM